VLYKCWPVHQNRIMLKLHLCNECCSTLCFIYKILSGHVMLNINAWLCVNLLNSLIIVPIFPLVLQTVVKRVAHTYKMPTALASICPLLYYLKLGIG